MTINGSALISLLLVVVLAAGLWEAKDWSQQAGLFPCVLGAAALILALWQLILDLVRRREAVAGEDVAGLVDLPVDRDVPASEALRRAGIAFAWIFGLTFALWAIGFGLAVPLFLFLYLLLQAKERWWFAGVTTLAMALFQYVVFDLLIHTNWPDGAIQQWLG
ncbi:MAG TPA: tripartite tricarboxylate transporter TctB family protein [Candidatus Binatia bacterium]